MREHLEFARRAVADHLEGPAAAALVAALGRLDTRMSDPDLYLAVVGEFSSGKSTFINALLREPLLQTSALPTTAAVTELRGGSPRVEVRLTGSPWRSCRGRDTRARLRALSGRPVPSDEVALVELLTADESVGPHVDGVRISRSSPLLDEGVVVLDTPGFDSENERHRQLSEQVIAEQADAFVVCTPATEPLTMTTLRLLRGPLQAHLDRCVFLLTRMAYVEEGQADKVIDYTGKRIASQLGIDDPLVLPCSVGAVVRGLEPGSELSRVDRAWADAFPEVESRLRARLRERRDADIAARMRVALDELLVDLTGALETCQAGLVERERALESQRLEPLDAVAAQLRQALGDRLALQAEDAIARAETRLDAAGARIRADVAKQLRAAPSKDALRRVRDGVPKTIKQRSRGLTNPVGAAAKGLQTSAAEMPREIDERFAASYRDVAGHQPPAARRSTVALAARVDVKPMLTRVAAMDASVSSTIADDNLLTGGAGAVVGGVIGTMLAPGIGTAAGAWLGGWFGTSSVARDREAYAQAFTSAFDNAMVEVRASARSALRDALSSLTHSVDARIDERLVAYRPSVTAAVARRRAEQQELTARRARLLEDLAQARGRLAAVRGGRPASPEHGNRTLGSDSWSPSMMISAPVARVAER